MIDILGTQIKLRERPWLKTKQFVLGTAENIEELIDSCINSKVVAIDTETTGLDTRIKCIAGINQTVDHIVGVCLSPDGFRGYYFPLRHMDAEWGGAKTPSAVNIPLSLFDQHFSRLIKNIEEKKTLAVFHHAKFDCEMLQFNETGKPWGDWEDLTLWDDTLILAYLKDPTEKRRGLKHLSNTLLGIDQIELEELFPKGYKGPLDFSILDPSDPAVLQYAGGDGICTYLLREKLLETVLEKDTDGLTQIFIYKLEKMATLATRWMERCKIHRSKEKVAELIKIGQRDWVESVKDVYETASQMLGREVTPGKFRLFLDTFNPDEIGKTIKEHLDSVGRRADTVYPVKQKSIVIDNKSWNYYYDVNSPQQLGQMFQEMGVPGLIFTEKSGQVKTSKDVLERVIAEAEESFPFMSKIRRLREITTALVKYLYPMYFYADDDGTMHISFKVEGTDTGRFATPKSDDKEITKGAPKINFQSIPAAYPDPKKSECLVRMRESITPRDKDFFMVSIDFSGEELRIVTNLSQEPKWLDEFFHCSGCNRVFEKTDENGVVQTPPKRCPNCGSDKIGDIHTLTALELYGKDAVAKPEWKDLRKKAKSTNFALLFGGGGTAVQRATRVDKNEGWRIKKQFDKTYSTLRQWWDQQHAFAKKYGYVRTAFNRKYPTPYIYSDDKMMVSAAERNSVNSPVQGTGADMIKIAMYLVYQEVKKRDWFDKCLMIATMHDELFFEIHKDILREAVEVIEDLMINNKAILSKKWPVPFTSDIEIGRDMTVEYNLAEMAAGEKRYIEDEEADEDTAGYSDLPTYPRCLQNIFTGDIPTTAKSKKEKPKSTNEYVYHLKDPLTSRTLEALMKTLQKCSGGGTKKLVVQTAEGPLDLGGDVYVNDIQFYIIAENYGLLCNQ